MSIDDKPERLAEVYPAYEAFMCTQFDVEVMVKDESWLMGLAASGLQMLGIQSRQEFMGGTPEQAGYATTIGRTIYYPRPWMPRDRVLTLAHEITHAEDYKRLGFVKMASSYGLYSDVRGDAEARGMVASIQLYRYFYGGLPSLPEMAASLQRYACNPTDVGVALKRLRSASITVELGGTIGEPARRTFAWFDANAPDLRAAP